MRIYLLLAHPDRNSFNGALADAYQAEALAAGHEVRRQNLGELSFDPVLHHGYHTLQPLEQDLEAAHDNIVWCEHWVIVYPIWWGSVPAPLKGFFDRVLYSGFAYRYHETDPLWDQLLKGRSAQIITTSDAPNIWTLIAYHNSDLGTVKHATLGFCGVRPVRVLRLDRMKDTTDPQRQAYLQRVRATVRHLAAPSPAPASDPAGGEASTFVR
jgi:NAD(P)H dehydrogenase (quinone)